MNRQPEKPGGLKRSLFLRLWVRSLTVKRPQAALASGAILVGATLAAALLNLHGGVERKMTQEFRAYGANILISPRGDSADGGQAQLIGDEILSSLTERTKGTSGVVLAPLLHMVMRLRPGQTDARLPEFQNAVVVGTDFGALRTLYPNWRLKLHINSLPLHENECVVGSRVAGQLRLAAGSELEIEPAEAASTTDAGLQCRVAGILSTGAAEDDQVFVPLAVLQRAAGLEGKLSLVEMMVPGEAEQIEKSVAELAKGFPSADVRPVRAIVESRGRVLGTIRWLLMSLTALIVVIVALCVMATMTAIVLERKKDVAVMKALGATDRLIMRLFLCEGAGLGLAGGVAGFGLGLLIARELGRSLFGVSLEPVWSTLPLIALGSVLIAVLATAFPVRMARAVQPAATLKGV